MVATLYGPVRITANRQISLPKALLDQIEMGPGDEMHVLRDDDGTLRLVSSRTVGQWLEIGRAGAQSSEGDLHA